MKKKLSHYKKILAVALLSTFSLLTFVPSSSTKAYTGEIHTWLNSRACAIISTSCPEVKKILTKKLPSGKTPESLIISTASTPDITENSNGRYIYHFYDPDTKLSYDGSSVTAKSQFNFHYYNAVALYKKGDKSNAYTELGMALHYLSDLNEPHHVSSKTFFNSNHSDYEKWVENNCTYRKQYAELKIGTDTFNWITKTSIDDIADNMARLAKSNLNNVLSYNNKNYAKAAESDLKRTQRAAAGIIYKFHKDVKAIK